MENYKLISLLESFDSSEYFYFKKFLVSPYHNEDEELLSLFQVLEKHLKSSKKILEKEKVWKEAFPNRSYDLVKMRLKFSYLLKLAERFLVTHSYLNNDEIQYNVRLGGILSKRDLPKHYAGIERKLEKNLEGNKLADTNQNESSFYIERLKHAHLSRLKKRKGENNLSTLHQKLDIFYLQEKLRFMIDALNVQRVRNVEIDVGISDEILKVLEQSDNLENKVLEIYHQFFKLLSDPDDEYLFFDLRQKMKNNYFRFQFEQVLVLYTILQNICIQQINSGKAIFLEKLFSVYEDILDIQLFTEKNAMTPWFYKNIITTGLLSGKFDWISNFIETYTDLLPEKERSNAYSYNLANLSFYKKEYHTTVEILNRVEFDDIVYDLGGRWLLVRAYYEMGEMMVLDSLLESFRLFLLRNKVMTQKNKKQYLNLIRFVQKLISIQPNDKNVLNKLKGKIEGQENVANKKWLLDKISEMLNANKVR